MLKIENLTTASVLQLMVLLQSFCFQAICPWPSKVPLPDKVN